MKKIINLVFLFVLLFTVPVQAGEYENALAKNKPVFLYMYTSYCKYCKKFEPVYSKLVKAESNNYTFVKTDADSSYGKTLMRQMRARYVPFVIIVDTNRQYAKMVEPACLIDYACIDNELKTFIK